MDSLCSPLLVRASLSSKDVAGVSPEEYSTRQGCTMLLGDDHETRDSDKPAASREANQFVQGRKKSQQIGFWGLLSEFIFYPRRNLMIFIIMAAFCAGQQILVAATMAECMGGFYKYVYVHKS
jgi:hypothetical protein